MLYLLRQIGHEFTPFHAAAGVSVPTGEHFDSVRKFAQDAVRRVPIGRKNRFFGPPFKPGIYDEFARVVDIAPTLANVLGVPPLERLDGHVLTRELRNQIGRDQRRVGDRFGYSRRHGFDRLQVEPVQRQFVMLGREVFGDAPRVP